ncbi:SLATT domain-containing protein [Moritella sp. 24]|uniref:SLATT domain-containing protein n=1 Tax=Moritella sp. 24 TaxID=2746230 RepID=UPI001BAB24DE|nr:SLATT domain-containing protein [Moritella sp. 24]QUM75526.1 SLATT domain-containing protein [Moritella sp. 24]
MSENIKKKANDDRAELEVVDAGNRSSIHELISNWLVRLADAQMAHYVQSERLYFKANISGYALITSSTIVTAMLFMNAVGAWKLLLVIMSISSATLSGVVSFSRFAEKAEQHRSAAGCYGKLRRQLEKLNTIKSSLNDNDLDKQLKILRIEWEYTSQNAPLTPYSALKKVMKLKEEQKKKLK